MKHFIRFVDQKGLSVLVLIASDAFWYFFSFLSAYYVRNNFWPTEIQEIGTYLKVIPLVLILMIFVFYLNGLYEQKNRISKISETYLLIKSLSTAFVLIMAASFLQKYDYSRILVVLFWLFSMAYIALGRYMLRKVKNLLLAKDYGVVKVLIVGAGKTGRKLAKRLEDYKDFGYRVQGFLDNSIRPKENMDYTIFGKNNEILKVIKNKNINLVFIADPAMSHEEILNLMQMCENTKVKFKVVSDLFEIVAGGVNINEIEEIPSLNFEKARANMFYLIMKRIMDLALSVIALIPILPFAIIIIFWIKLDSPGKAVFAQERVGLNGKIFKMYKFRTMNSDTKKHAFSPRSQNDSRLTSAGKFLRKTSLDELPQVINVLKGEMSLVGPRPEMPFIVEKYKTWQRRRLEAKPGITGLWQILGRKDLPLLENIEYDFYYIKNRSLLLDLVIIFKTILVVFTGKGAY